jgi:hypothetical protein
MAIPPCDIQLQCAVACLFASEIGIRHTLVTCESSSFDRLLLRGNHHALFANCECFLAQPNLSARPRHIRYRRTFAAFRHFADVVQGAQNPLLAPAQPSVSRPRRRPWQAHKRFITLVLRAHEPPSGCQAIALHFPLIPYARPGTIGCGATLPGFSANSGMSHTIRFRSFA